MALTVSYSRIDNPSEFQTNIGVIQGAQLAPDVLGLPDGSFFAAHNNEDLNDGFMIVNFFASTFFPQTAFANEFSDKSIGAPSLTELSDGNVLLVWDDDDPADAGLKGRLFTPAAIPSAGNEIDLAGPTTSFADPQVAGLDGGGFALAFTHGTDVFCGRYTNAGNLQGGFASVNSVAITGDQNDPAVAALADGGYVVTYTDTNPADWQIRATIFNADGTPRLEDFLIADFGINFRSKVVGLPNGNFAVVYGDTGWNETNPGPAPGDGSGISLQIFEPARGAAVTPVIHVNTPSPVNEGHPDVTALANGFIVVTWGTLGMDNILGDIHARIFDQSGSPITVNGDADEFLLTPTGEGKFAAVSRMGSGKFITTWQTVQEDGGGDPDLGRINSTTSDLRRIVEGDGADDTFTGDALRDFVKGGPGKDTLDGGDGDDLLQGETDADTLTGGAGNDVFAFGPGGGADIITDFVAGAATVDGIELRALPAHLDALGDILGLATQVGANTVIDFGKGDTITLNNVAKGNLSVDDFLLTYHVPNDFSGGGRSDILWRHDNGTTNVFTMDGASVLSGSNTTQQVDSDWTLQDKADFNGDGRADILWRHANFTSNIFLMDGATVIGGSNLSQQVNAAWTVQSAADFNGDGMADILWRHGNGTANVFLMDGTFVIGSSNISQQVGPSWTVQDTADFNGDGRADILWRHLNGTSNVFLMDGSSVIGGSNTSQQVDNNWTVQGVGDFNGDGKSDILWRHANGTSNVFLMDGATVIGGSNTSQQVDDNWSVADTGDYNGDGKADILWRHDNGTTNVFLMDGATVIGGSNTSVQVGTDWHVM